MILLFNIFNVYGFANNSKAMTTYGFLFQCLQATVKLLTQTNSSNSHRKVIRKTTINKLLDRMWTHNIHNHLNLNIRVTNINRHQGLNIRVTNVNQQQGLNIRATNINHQQGLPISTTNRASPSRLQISDPTGGRSISELPILTDKRQRRASANKCSGILFFKKIILFYCIIYK